ncbi:hypothetical protein M885DRAFT_515280 [Pelagophyceae sp. CCMP2097]|nr:hypothetical protein M885DRAFT_515280 [Pelagophyceae sp. CCMP2097]
MRCRFAVWLACARAAWALRPAARVSGVSRGAARVRLFSEATTGAPTGAPAAAGASDVCGCKSGLPYDECCAPLHDVTGPGRNEATPLAILRGRYTAYSRDAPDFIMATTHRGNEDWSADSDAWRAKIRAFARTCTFVDLNVYSRETVDEDCIKITWCARIKLLDGIVDPEYVETTDFFECSVFIRESGVWWYSKGDPDFEPKNMRVSGPLDEPPSPPKARQGVLGRPADRSREDKSRATADVPARSSAARR